MLGAALLVALALSATEAFWRSQGHRPSADAEDLDLWAHQRRRASNRAVETIVIIGKSRAQLDVDVPTIRTRYPQSTVVQLALRGRSAWATFADLAQDRSFSGRVLWFVTEPDLTPQAHQAQQPAVDRGRKAGPDAIAQARLRAAVASRMAARHADLGLQRLLKNASRGRLPPAHFIEMSPDRAAGADFQRAPVPVLKQQILQVHDDMRTRMGQGRVDPVRWRRDVSALRPLVTALRDRGGDVVLVSPPVSDESKTFGDEFYPKALFWDTLRSAAGVLTVRAEELAGPPFSCPDTSHLDRADAPRFTGALLDRLVKLGFFGG